MSLVMLALVLVSLTAVIGVGFGIAAGFATGAMAGVEGRPYVYWLISAAYLVLCTLHWPVLVSWLVDVDLPTWHRRLLTAEGASFERPRSGRPLLEFARSLDPRQRPGLAAGILVRGLIYNAIAIPVPIMFGIAALRTGQLHILEAVPVAVSVWGPAVLTVIILLRSRTGRLRH